MCDSKYRVYKDGNPIPYDVPCGKCAVCKRRRVSQWVFRLQQEEKISSSSKFITLTYDAKNLPLTANNFPTLHKPDFQKFMKRLRKRQKTKIRYYAVGEYGTLRQRPHYHAILFNVEDEEYITQAWGLGATHIGTVTASSIAYTAKYIDKDKQIPVHKNDKRVKEFSLMSKGIGKNYITPASKQYHKSDLTRCFVTTPQNIRVAIPRYYRNKIYTEKERKKQNEIISDLISEKQRIDFKEYLKNTTQQITLPEWEANQKIVRATKFKSQLKIRENG